MSYQLLEVASTLHFDFRACILDESEVVVHDKSPYRFVDDVFQMTMSRLDNFGSFKMIAMSRQLEQVTAKHHVISRLL